MYVWMLKKNNSSAGISSKVGPTMTSSGYAERWLVRLANGRTIRI
jgi:hypothetical protein